MKKLVLVLLTLSFPIVFFAQDPSDSQSCMECHHDNNKDIPVITVEMVERSAHEGSDCIECHEDITELPHLEKLEKVNCGECHEDETAIYKYHGIFEIGTEEDLPACASCHGTHNILGPSDKKSKIHPLNLPDTCGKCHENQALTKEHKFLPEKPVQTYKQSIHGQSTSGGIYTAASCNDCHSTNGSAHQILSPGNPISAINHFAIPKTCGKCHERIEKDYWEGIHGQQTKRGKTDSPVCTSCHGEHQIFSKSDQRSSVSQTHLAESTCAPCHESASLAEKYGLPAGRLASFMDSYHGLKSSAGDITVANCASCHGAHRVLPHTDSTSSVHLNNLQKTCGYCHPGISKELATSRIHEAGGLHKSGWPNFFSILYIWLITATVTFMLLYIILDIWRQTKKTMQLEQIRRMSGWGVIQHTMLMISFTSLVITGFALRFSDSWWAVFLYGREGGFPIRNLAHRIAAITFMLTAVIHLLYLLSKRGNTFIKDVFPGLRDVKELIQMLKYNLGFAKERPKFTRFSFIEKFEYWAMIWGAILMSVTGLMLWFDNFLVNYLPKGVLDVMLVIHYYEAWLALLSILIWHLYSVIFNPRVYPMNPSWITGTMPRDQYIHEHPDEKIK